MREAVRKKTEEWGRKLPLFSINSPISNTTKKKQIRGGVHS